MVLILRANALYLYCAILTGYALQSAYSDLGQYHTEELSTQGTILRYPLGTRTHELYRMIGSLRTPDRRPSFLPMWELCNENNFGLIYNSKAGRRSQQAK